MQVLSLLAAATFFQGHELKVITVALPQVRHSFGLSQGQASDWLALLAIGALPALLLARRADRVGRRRLLLVSITGLTAATAASAAAPTILCFALCQLCVGAFTALEVTLSWTVIAEELPPGARGFGFGVLATLSTLGAGTAALAWALLLSPHDLSWRWLYAAATSVLLLAAFMRRRLPESSRFESAASAGRLAPGLDVLGLRVRRPAHPGGRVRDRLHADAAAPVPAGSQPDRGRCRRLALPVLAGAGSISDRLGRKRIGCSFLALSVAGTLCFFFLARSPVGYFLALVVTYVGQFGAWPTLSGFSTELFPTSHRALATSASGIASVAGQSGSFLLAGLLIGLTGSLAHAVAVLAVGPLVAVVLIAAGFPETAGRDLDQTSGELATIRPQTAASDGRQADLGLQGNRERFLAGPCGLRRCAPRH